MSLRGTLKKTDLPDDIQKLIRRVVRRTRLRRHERADVANELIVHFEDAIEDGVEPAQAITDYGNVKTAAKLLRIAKKRQRWWFDRAFVRACKWSGTAVGCFLLLYAVFVVFALGRKPTIAIDYVAKLNETATAIAEADRAWPYYREAGIALLNNPAEVVIDGEMVWPDTPSETGGSEYAAWLDTHQETLALIRQGAAKKGMGYIAEVEIAEEDRKLWPDLYRDGYGSDSGMVFSVLLPQLSHVRQMAKLLRFDAIIAAEAGDSQLCFDDIQAILSIATQSREHPFLINDLVSTSIYNITFQTLREILEHDPALFSVAQLRTVKEQLLTLDPEFIVRFEGERISMLDTVQRIYTDDGNGDGVIIPMQMFRATALRGPASESQVPQSFISAIVTPLGDLLYPSRKEFVDEYDKRLAQLGLYKDIPLYEWSNSDFEYYQDTPILNKNYLLDLLMPAFQRLLLQEKYTKSYRDGTVAMLYALELHQATGTWPADLTEASVVDGWSGKPFLIADVEGQPVIYSIGVDRDDDGGAEVKDAGYWRPRRIDQKSVSDQDDMGWPSQEWRNRFPDGDWVFFSLKQNDE